MWHGENNSCWTCEWAERRSEEAVSGVRSRKTSITDLWPDWQEENQTYSDIFAGFLSDRLSDFLPAILLLYDTSYKDACIKETPNPTFYSRKKTLANIGLWQHFQFGSTVNMKESKQSNGATLSLAQPWTLGSITRNNNYNLPHVKLVYKICKQSVHKHW